MLCMVLTVVVDFIYILNLCLLLYFTLMKSSYSPIGCLPRWRIGKCSPDMEGTREIKYLGQTRVASAALLEDIDMS